MSITELHKQKMREIVHKNLKLQKKNCQEAKRMVKNWEENYGKRKD